MSIPRSHIYQLFTFKVWAYFRNTGHECDIDKYGHTLVNLWQSEDEIPLNHNSNQCENSEIKLKMALPTGTICNKCLK